MTTLVDARGVPIKAFQHVVYGFGVSRSVAMAEGTIVGEPSKIRPGCYVPALTPSGRVKVKIIRRSYSSGEKLVVDVAADRLVVVTLLPESPLPTQAEKARKAIEGKMPLYTADLRATEVPGWAAASGWTLVDLHANAAKRLKELRKKLKALDGEGE
jgi:hypothetical protein